MTIYRDSEYRCHIENDGTMSAVETEVFDGKCDAYIEGHRLVLTGETWVRADGVAFGGAYEMVAPWKDSSELAAVQRQYELDRAALEKAYREGVNSLD